MEKIIKISGKDIKLASTAGTLYKYRVNFHRDFLKDLVHLDKKLKEIKHSTCKDQYAEFNALELEVFEQMAWTMAKTADPSCPPIENWLDNFETFGIYEVLPEIMEIASSNFNTGEEKKI